MVPNGPAETAIFGISNVTAISIPPDLSVGTVIFEFQSSAYTITFSAGDFFEFNDGISNVSGLTQDFVAGTDGSGNAGIFQINQAASFSGPNIFTTEAATVPGGNVGIVQFVDESNAGDATIINNGGVMPGAEGGETIFFSLTSASTATITNKAGTVSGKFGGSTSFMLQTPGAGSSVITCEGATVSGAAGGLTTFQDSSTAGSSTLIANGGSNGGGGGTIRFTGSSKSGKSEIELFGNGILDISARAVTIGSLRAMARFSSAFER